LRRFEDADALLREAAGIARRALSADNFLTGEILASLGNNLAKLARFDEAEQALLEAHAWLERTLGPEAPPTLNTAGLLRDVYEMQGKAEAAAEWDQRARSG
jgi:hypothetical protein